MYQRRSEIAFYTPSLRWNLAAQEYDYYAMEIATHVMKNLTDLKNTTFEKMINFEDSLKHTAEYKEMEKDYDLLTRQVAAYALPVQELACSVVYPRCARCQDVVENPKKMFKDNEEYMSCFDPTTCRALCKKVMKMHDSFSEQFQHCIVGGKCRNSTSHRIFHSNISSLKFRVMENKDDFYKEICHSEEICPWRSLPGHRQYDNSYDDRNSYDFDPIQRTIWWCSVFGVVVVFLTFVCWFVSRYVVDIWKQRRQSGASSELRDDSGQQKWRERPRNLNQNQSVDRNQTAKQQTSTFAFEDLQGGG